MLESVSERLMETVHAGSPTKHPARRLETIAAAGELRIPFTSGILVGIGETEDGADGRRWPRWPRSRSATAISRSSSCRTSFPTRATTAANRPRSPAPPPRSTGAPAWGTGPQLDAPAWASPVSVEDMKRLVAETRRLMPEIGIQVPPNLSDWWPELVRAGATDLGGLSANGDHISPEHPFPSPTQVRKRLAPDGVAVSERLCVYPEYIDPEWIAEPVLDVITQPLLVVHPPPGQWPAGRAAGRRRRRPASDRAGREVVTR